MRRVFISISVGNRHTVSHSLTLNASHFHVHYLCALTSARVIYVLLIGGITDLKKAIEGCAHESM